MGCGLRVAGCDACIAFAVLEVEVVGDGWKWIPTRTWPMRWVVVAAAVVSRGDLKLDTMLGKINALVALYLRVARHGCNGRGCDLVEVALGVVATHAGVRVAATHET